MLNLARNLASLARAVLDELRHLGAPMPQDVTLRVNGEKA